MKFIIANPGLASLILMVFACVVTVALDIGRNGATFPQLWQTLKRDKIVSAIMVIIVYAVCYLATDAFRRLLIQFLHA